MITYYEKSPFASIHVYDEPIEIMIGGIHEGDDIETVKTRFIVKKHSTGREIPASSYQEAEDIRNGIVFQCKHS